MAGSGAGHDEEENNSGGGASVSRRGKEFYMRLLGEALLEIRSSDHHEQSPHARAIADTFHNLPAELAGP